MALILVFSHCFFLSSVLKTFCIGSSKPHKVKVEFVLSLPHPLQLSNLLGFNPILREATGFS